MTEGCRRRAADTWRLALHADIPEAKVSVYTNGPPKMRGKDKIMQKKNLRNGQTLINKLTQGRYVYNAETGKAVEIVPEGQTAAEITITGENAVCFAVVNDPNWDKYQFEDNILTANGMPVQTGTIKVTGILATGKDKVLLTVEPLKAEGLPEDGEPVGIPEDLFIYIPSLDKFKKLMGNIVIKDSILDTDNVKAWTFENRTKKTRKVDKVNPDGTVVKVDEEYEEFVKAGVITWNVENAKLGWVSYNNVLGIPSAVQDGVDKVYDENGEVVKETAFTEICLVTNETTLTVDCDDEADEYDEDDECDEYDDYYGRSSSESDPEIVKSDYKTVHIVSISSKGYIKPVDTATVNGEFEAFARAGRSVIIKTDKAIYIGGMVLTDNPYAVAMLKGYDYLVKTEIKKDGSRELVFSNAAYEVKRVIIEQTDDRGEIVKEG